MGCKVKLPRKDMAAHLTENVVKHVSLQAKGYLQLKEENEQLKKQVAKLTQDLKLQQICTPICPVEFTMTKFEQHRTNKNTWYSPPFYSHPRGHKMSLFVTANNHDESNGTDTSIGVCLMNGEFDDQLQWPFHGIITIWLLSQEDKKHLQAAISLSTGDYYMSSTGATRVHGPTEDKEIARRSAKISYNDLQTKYLKNDTLKLRAHDIKVEV